MFKLFAMVHGYYAPLPEGHGIALPEKEPRR